MRSWLPLKLQELRQFCESWLSTITPAPQDYGQVVGDVTLLNTNLTAYQNALSASEEPSTRTSVTVAATRMAKKTLITTMRNLHKKVMAANLADNRLEALGLEPRNLPSPIPPPAMKPNIVIVSRDDNTVKIKFQDPTDPDRRGRPEGVDGIAVFTHVGPVAPNVEDEWTFSGNTTRMVVDIPFPASVAPGSKVWFTAFFFNPRGQNGPAATPVSTNLPGGAAMAA
jgi:hypothetical protein